jgi:hypothetical protein
MARAAGSDGPSGRCSPPADTEHCRPMHPHTIPCHTFERVLRPLLPWISLVAASFGAALVLALLPPVPALDGVASADATCAVAQVADAMAPR